MKKILTLIALAAATLAGAQAQTSYTSTSATTAWNASRWNNSADGPTYTSTYTANNNVAFTSGNYSIGGMGASTNVGNITLSSNVTVNFTAGSTFATNGAVRTISLGSGSLFDFNTQQISTAAGTGFIISGSGVFGTGTYTSTTNAQSFRIDSGTVIVRGTTGLGNGANSTLTLNGGTVASNATRNLTGKYGGGITIGGNVQFGAFAANVALANDTANLSFDDTMALGASSRTLTLGNRGTMTFGGVISGSNGSGITFAAASGAESTVASNGVFAITGTANTFNGTININGPEVTFAADGSFGNTANTVNIDGGRLTTTANMTLTSGRGIQVGSTAGTSISAKSGTTLTYNGVIADKSGATGAWAKQGGGTFALGGVSTYTGATAINNGILQLTTGNDRLPTGTVVSIGQAASTNLGTFDLNGQNQQIAGLNSVTGTGATGNNTVTSSAASTLTIGGSGTYSYGSSSANNTGLITGAISLVKSGNGTQTLGGANSYTGNTTINAGTLIINGSTAAGSAVAVNNGGTLGGNGTVNGSVTVASGGTLAPGNSPGLQTLGATTLNGGGNYNWQIVNATGSAGSGYDSITLTPGSALTLNNTSGNKYNINLWSLSSTGPDVNGDATNFNNATNFTWTLFATDQTITGFSADKFAINVGIANGTNGFSNALAGGTFSVGLADSNTDLVLNFTAVPEAKTWVLIGIGSAFMLWNLRRKRRNQD